MNWLDPREAAAHVKLTKKNSWRTLVREARLGKLKAGHNGRTYLFLEESLDTWMIAKAKGRPS